MSINCLCLSLVKDQCAGNLNIAALTVHLSCVLLSAQAVVVFRPRLYERVQIISMVCKDSLEHRLQFDMSPQLKRVRWQSSKRLLYGSLVCLTMDDFDSLFFAVVTNRDVKDLEKVMYEKVLSDKTLSRKVLSDKALSKKVLSEVSRRVLSEKALSGKVSENLSKTILSEKALSRKVSEKFSETVLSKKVSRKVMQKKALSSKRRYCVRRFCMRRFYQGRYYQ